MDRKKPTDGPGQTAKNFSIVDVSIVTQLGAFGSYQTVRERGYPPPVATFADCLMGFNHQKEKVIYMHTKRWNDLSLSQRLAWLKLSVQKPKRIGLIKRLNCFFFLDDPDDKLHPADGWMFYGVLGGAMVLTMFVWVVTL